MKVSIITVCYNASDTIENTFKSVFEQSCSDYELVVIDGGSTDGTPDIIKKYQDKISYFVSEPDHGIYNAMNKGINAASGEFICFLNANDTFFDENVLEKFVWAMEKNPEIKFFFGDANYVYGENSSQLVRFDEIKNDFSLIFGNICHQSIFYHRSLFEKFGLYDEEYKLYADWDFNIKCLVQNKVAAMYLPLVVSNFLIGGACSNENSKKICKREKKLLIKKYYKKYEKSLFIDELLRKNFASIYKLILKTPLNKFFVFYSPKDSYSLNLKPESNIF